MSGRPASAHLHRPPAPEPVGDARTILRVVLGREFDLIAALPRSAYSVMMGRHTYFNRRIYLVNDPVAARRILVDRADLYPKSEGFADALSPLVGDGVFVSNGEAWRRQRSMIRPALSQMGLRGARRHMDAAIESFAGRLRRAADTGAPVALDQELSHVTADIIFRTIFAEPIEGREAGIIFDGFVTIQALSNRLSVRKLLYSLRTARPARSAPFNEACRRIRDTIGRMVERHGPGAAPSAGMAEELAGAVDPATGRGFDREELIDQIAVFFLAGHETTASLLTWALIILAELPEFTARLRAEVDGLDPSAEDVQAELPLLRSVLRETLRLYPPVSFLMRRPLEPDEVRGFRLRPSDIVVVSPWVMHRHAQLWRDADRFDPDRFAPEHADAIVRDSYIPFGLGPRACPGAAFATLESVLILARLLAEFELEPVGSASVRPTARLTLRPPSPVLRRVRRRA